MADQFPSPEAFEVAKRVKQQPHGASISDHLIAAYAVDEPKIRADERRRIVEMLRSTDVRGPLMTWDTVADYVERTCASRNPDPPGASDA